MTMYKILYHHTDGRRGVLTITDLSRGQAITQAEQWLVETYGSTENFQLEVIQEI